MIHKVFLLRKVVWQQGVTALLLYQAQTVAFRLQRLRIPKKTVRSLFLILRLTYCAGRWQSTSWLCYCLIKSRTRSPGNHHTIGITAHVDCTEYSSLDESVCFHGSGTRAGFDSWCSDSPIRRCFQYKYSQRNSL